MDTEDLYRAAKVVEEPNEEIVNEMKNFNWGAFGLGFIWGIGNNIYVKNLIIPCIIVFVLWLFKILNVIWHMPIIGIPLYIGIIFGPLFYFGKNGNRWAWNERTWNSIQEFSATQKKWAIGVLIIYTIITFLAICFIISLSITSKDKYTNTAIRLINILMSDFNYKYAENGSKAAEYVVNYLKEENSHNTRVSLFNDNTIKFSTMNKSKNKYEPTALYTITKEKSCSLKDKNCFITTYIIKNQKTVSKTYFDDNGDINIIKYVGNEK